MSITLISLIPELAGSWPSTRMWKHPLRNKGKQEQLRQTFITQAPAAPGPVSPPIVGDTGGCCCDRLIKTLSDRHGQPGHRRCCFQNHPHRAALAIKLLFLIPEGSEHRIRSQGKRQRKQNRGCHWVVKRINLLMVDDIHLKNVIQLFSRRISVVQSSHMGNRNSAREIPTGNNHNILFLSPRESGLRIKNYIRKDCIILKLLVLEWSPGWLWSSW